MLDAARLGEDVATVATVAQGVATVAATAFITSIVGLGPRLVAIISPLSVFCQTAGLARLQVNAKETPAAGGGASN
jgi:hypothetical protein